MKSPSIAHKKITPRGFSVKKVKRRILVASLFYLLFFVIIIGRAFILHLSDNEKLSRLAQAQYKKKIALSPKRGNIYDNKGEEMALDVQVYSVYANPQAIKDLPQSIQKLSPLLNLSKEKLEKILNLEKKFVWLKRRMEDEEYEKIKELKIEGLGFMKEYKRLYPNQNLASTLLGAVGLDSTGLSGLEYYFEKYIKAKTEPLTVHADARGQTYSPEGLLEIEEPANIYLTLDKTIQFIVEKELKAQIQKTSAKSGIAIVMDVQTGEILALANYPDFDPNNYSNYSSENWRNQVVTDSFEPGSIFKAITAAAALESGKWNLDKKINCENGAMQVGKFVINDHGSYGEMNLAEIIRVSNNIGSYKIAQFLGREEFAKHVVNFGFGMKTEVDLPGEIRGIMENPEKWSSLKMGTIAFGQGISVTPIQVVTAYAAIANGGELLKPHILKKVIDSKGNVIIERKKEVLRRVMSLQNAQKLVEMLRGVVGPGGTGTLAEIEEYGAAGKTGTAQKVLAGSKGYSSDKYIASFAGIAPALSPKIAVLVSINEPQGNHFGGIVSAPVFREISRKTLHYLGVKPLSQKGPLILTKGDELPESQPSSVTSQDKNKQKQILQKPQPLLEEDNPLKSTESQSSVTVQDPNFVTIPNCSGKSLRSLLKEIPEESLKLSFEGSGMCVGQSIAPGKKVKKGTEIKFQFKIP